MLYSVEQENAGRVAGARAWGDRQWQQTCGVTLEEVDSCAPLLVWVGDDLIIWNYPAEKQAEVQAKREAGRRGGLSSGRARAKQAGSRTEAQLQAEVQRKWEVGKEDQYLGATAVSPSGVSDYEGGKPRNPLLDALATVGGGSISDVTKSAFGAAARALAEIKGVTPDVAPAEILRRGENYAARFPRAALTASALAKHWAACATPPASIPDRSGDRSSGQSVWALREKQKAILANIERMKSDGRTFKSAAYCKEGEEPGYSWLPGVEDKIAAEREKHAEIERQIAAIS
jgi:hypothetical protein